jgi:hypothetical protein
MICYPNFENLGLQSRPLTVLVPGTRYLPFIGRYRYLVCLKAVLSGIMHHVQCITSKILIELKDT